MASSKAAISHQVEIELTELAESVSPGVAAAVAALRLRHGDAVAGILFYGSCLRDRQDHGRLIDLYVLVRRYRDLHGHSVSAALNALLPPNVYYLETSEGDRTVRAKYAVLSLDDLRRGTRAGAFHSSIWGRFAQPCALVHCRAPEVRGTVVEALSSAVRTMAVETAPLLPGGAGSAELWQRAFRESYRTEFRAERNDRPADLYGCYRARYDRFTEVMSIAGELRHDAAARRRSLRRWRVRRAVGKTLHVLRLAKATFTFAGGLDYILWKIETHSGVKANATPWQRRHPLLAAPTLAVQLYRRGAFR